MIDDSLFTRDECLACFTSVVQIGGLISFEIAMTWLNRANNPRRFRIETSECDIGGES